MAAKLVYSLLYHTGARLKSWTEHFMQEQRIFYQEGQKLDNEKPK